MASDLQPTLVGPYATQQLHLAIANVQSEVEKATTDLKEMTTPEEYNKLHEALKENITKRREQIMKNNIKKCERDTKDYLYNHVYTWADERAKNRRYEKQDETDTSSRKQIRTMNKNLNNRTIYFLMTLLDLVLSKNYFRFCSKIYLQLQGTLMAKNVMASFGSQFVISDPYVDKIAKWARYVDDVFLMWKGTEIELEHFKDYLHSRHELMSSQLPKAQMLSST